LPGRPAHGGVLHRRFAIDQRSGPRTPPLFGLAALANLSGLSPALAALHPGAALAQRAPQTTRPRSRRPGWLLARAGEGGRRNHPPAPRAGPQILGAGALSLSPHLQSS